MTAYVYRAFDTQDRLLYVGCTSDPLNRFNCHRSHKSPWLPFAARLTWEVFPTRTAAFGAESLAIMGEEPRYNQAGKRGAVTGEPFPDAEPSGVVLGDLILHAPGRVPSVHDRKRHALRVLQGETA